MSNPPLDLDPAVVAQVFEAFSAYEAPMAGSPLYAELCAGIAGDDELIALACEARSLPVPNVLLAAVHYLVLREPEHPLARFYPSAGGTAAPDGAYPAFREFCLDRRAAIAALLATQRTQTNEVGRCACTLPALCRVAADTGRPLAVIEIGASAGLNLLFDRYTYDYGTGAVYGAAASSVRLTCTWRASVAPPIPTPLPPVVYRVGVDLHPIDVHDPDATAWVRALIWPEHSARAELLRRAVEFARADPPTVLAGDGVAWLPEVLRAAPQEAAVCVLHSFTINQFTATAHAAFDALLREHAASRPVFRVSMEHEVREHAVLRLRTYTGSEKTSSVLATCHPHAHWIDWQRAA